MPPIIRNVIAVIVGLVAGSVINMAIVTIGPMLMPLPAGVDQSNVEAFAKTIHLLEPKHFITPFLAHALGTLAGALAAYLIAASSKNLMAYIVGGFFLIGGIVACFIIPAPLWYMALDLVAAYIPMAWLAALLGRKLSSS